ncbi:MAG: ABC transporter ATP-binding protein [Paludibacterium sp.]|uniref:metal ABC transporter ATP-binding protein n=1 Tax=Paludibacterium sp. TaxID=1917523 RepID=UPI0025DDAC64|nr:ABC transporter ATP-binding protein [Paludibacterium sp.]MBV8049530.1 ABC transporter ATP-binding protein [Paludibacterium sp.]MBV8646209.1 ABC transporter ATP-binding protein [Paludibacterium sp.]
MEVLRLDRVTVTFRDRRVLDDVSLMVEQNQFIGVLGPNGAGKTTLMRAILGLIRPDAGQITVLGQSGLRGNPDIGYMPQVRSANASLRLCGRDFVAIALHGHRWGWPRLNRQAWLDVDRALELVDARDLARRPLAELSGGQRQRLLLAQALIGRPRLLLLDEPLISLDPRHQHGVIELVRQVREALGITVLFSAHELNPLLPAIDQVLYLGHGHLALGPVDEVIQPDVLSRLYGAPIDVVRQNGRVFVMSGEVDVEKEEHCHDA